MKEIVATITKRGQITVPAEVRRRLGVKTGDKVAFSIEDDKVEVRRARFTVETAFASVPPLKHPMSDEEMSRIAKEEKAERTVREMQKQ